jgi:hypothetical protein
MSVYLIVCYPERSQSTRLTVTSISFFFSTTHTCVHLLYRAIHNHSDLHFNLHQGKHKNRIGYFSFLYFLLVAFLLPITPQDLALKIFLFLKSLSKYIHCLTFSGNDTLPYASRLTKEYFVVVI